MQAINPNLKLFNHYSPEELLSICLKINEDILLMKEYLTLDLLPLAKLTGQYAGMETKAEDNMVGYAKNIQEVTTRLQIHDAFCQKLEHIHTIQSGVILDICELKHEEDIPSTSHLAIFFEILLLNKEQLAIMKAEYFSVVRLINTIFFQIQLIVKGRWSNPSTKMNNHFWFSDLFEKAVERTDSAMQEIIGKINHSYGSEEKEMKLHNISKVYTMESERQLIFKIFGATEPEEKRLSYILLNADELELF